RIIIDCPWFCVIWQHRWNNPALPGHSPPRRRLKAGWRQLESLCDRHRYREALMRFPTARGMDSTFWGEVHELAPSSLFHRRGRGVALWPGGAATACGAVAPVAHDPPTGGGPGRNAAGAHATRRAPDPGRA